MTQIDDRSIPQKLVGVSAIARHLGVPRPRAAYWIRRRVLPVYMPPGTRGVFAFVDEIEAWVRSGALRPQGDK